MKSGSTLNETHLKTAKTILTNSCLRYEGPRKMYLVPIRHTTTQSSLRETFKCEQRYPHARHTAGPRVKAPQAQVHTTKGSEATSTPPPSSLKAEGEERARTREAAGTPESAQEPADDAPSARGISAESLRAGA